ncbi:MAG: TIGR02301 family protein [Roseiarcus sp.]
MRRSLSAAALTLIACAALAQTPAPKAPPTPTPSPSPAMTAPPYDPQLMRLAELLGALSYLRDLCGAGDGAAFRDKMSTLIDAEAHSQERKDLFAGAFNRGFSDYELTYRRCTSSARQTIVDYLDESARIAREVATRYGG